MKIVAIVLGVLFILTGLLWVLQGSGILPGSPMTGQLVWLFAGLVGLIAGAGLIVWARRGTNRPGA